jgi:hypothetical protein
MVLSGILMPVISCPSQKRATHLAAGDQKSRLPLISKSEVILMNFLLWIGGPGERTIGNLMQPSNHSVSTLYETKYLICYKVYVDITLQRIRIKKRLKSNQGLMR